MASKTVFVMLMGLTRWFEAQWRQFFANIDNFVELTSHSDAWIWLSDDFCDDDDRQQTNWLLYTLCMCTGQSVHGVANIAAIKYDVEWYNMTLCFVIRCGMMMRWSVLCVSPLRWRRSSENLTCLPPGSSFPFTDSPRPYLHHLHKPQHQQLNNLRISSSK